MVDIRELEDRIEDILAKHIPQVSQELLSDMTVYVHRIAIEEYTEGYRDAERNHTQHT